MKKFNFESLHLGEMASGHLHLNLTEKISWEEFPAFAEVLTKKIGAKILQKNESVEMIIWDVVIKGISLQFVFDDYPIMSSFESNSDEGDEILKKFYCLFKVQPATQP